MALLQCGFLKSPSTLKCTRAWILLPQDKPGNPEPRATLYLLHGRYGDGETWVRNTNIERYALKYNLAVIMPEVGNSFYSDMRHGGKYFTYITEELPGLCGKMFGINRDPAHTYIAGLSMGGYGALKCAFNRPDLYAGCASFSAVTDMKKRIAITAKDDPDLHDLEAIYGAHLSVPPEDDLFALSKKAAKLKTRPSLMITCGLEDHRCEQNRALSAHLRENGYTHEYLEWEGKHNWDFWEPSIKKALAFFFGPPQLPQQ